MKKVLFFLLLGFSAFSQTPYDISVSHDNSKRVSTQQVSLANPWVGAKLSYNVNEENPLDQNFLFTAKVLYTPVSTDKYAIPIVVAASPQGGNLSSGESGYNIGVYPYYKLFKSSTATLLAHGGVNYKVLDNPSQGASNQQIRALLGLEVGFTSKEGSAPITISATPIFTHTNNGIGKHSFFEITGVVPVGKGLGALVEWQSGGSLSSGVKIGIIVNSSL